MILSGSSCRLAPNPNGSSRTSPFDDDDVVVVDVASVSSSSPAPLARVRAPPRLRSDAPRFPTTRAAAPPTAGVVDAYRRRRAFVVARVDVVVSVIVIVIVIERAHFWRPRVHVIDV
jgi:hypothetical protein